MSDFFASLLDRAQQRAPVLQWRQPSLFEGQTVVSPAPEPLFDVTPPRLSTLPPPLPSPSLPVITPSHSINEASTPLARAASVQATPPQLIAPAPAPLAANITPIPPVSPILPEPSVRHVETIRDTRTTLETREIHQHHTTIVERMLPPVANNVAAPPASAPRVVARPAASVMPVAANSRLQTIRVEPAATAKPARPSNPPESKPSPALQQQRHAAPKLTAPTLARSPSLAPSAIATAAPPAPTIQVSIGRIEIKANNTPTPARSATRPAGPKLTLDEYMRSQTGGRK